MRQLCLLLLLLLSSAAHAHQSELSSLMLYEQNGKTILLIRSSLAAFEGEVKYHFTEKPYHTPQEFNALVVQYFRQNCQITLNGAPVRFANVQVRLGHETTLFAELQDVPKTITQLQVQNTLFQDMMNNQCELIVLLPGLPQKQLILNNDNHQQVDLQVVNQQWVTEQISSSLAFMPSTTAAGIVFIVLGGIIAYWLIRKRNPVVAAP